VTGRRVAALLLAATVVGACGIDVQDAPETIGSDEVPFGFDDSGTTSTSRGPSGDDLVPFLVYFIGPDGIAFAIRQAATTPTVGERLDALFEGPSSAEVAVGLHTAIPPAAERLTARVRSGTAQVALHETFASLRGGEQVEALAQIVFTVTEIDTIRRVRFLLEGQPVEVPRADGTVSDDPVTRADYRLRSDDVPLSPTTRAPTTTSPATTTGATPQSTSRV
jgi:hypothetical protein